MQSCDKSSAVLFSPSLYTHTRTFLPPLINYPFLHSHRFVQATAAQSAALQLQLWQRECQSTKAFYYCTTGHLPHSPAASMMKDCLQFLIEPAKKLKIRLKVRLFDSVPLWWSAACSPPRCKMYIKSCFFFFLSSASLPQETRKRVKLEKKEPLVESQLFIMELARELNKICQVSSAPDPFFLSLTLMSLQQVYYLYFYPRGQTSSDTSGPVRTSGLPVCVGILLWNGLLCWRREYRYAQSAVCWGCRGTSVCIYISTIKQSSCVTCIDWTTKIDLINT